MKVRDAGGIHAVGKIRVRDATGLHLAAAGRMRNAGNALKTFFSGASGIVATIAPSSTVTEGAPTQDTSAFTASVVGGVATAYDWTVSGGILVSGQGTNTIQVRVHPSAANEPETADIQCTVTVGGTGYIATATKTYTWLL